MNEVIEKLKMQMQEINKKGWITISDNDLGACGNTFERLLNKEKDNFPWPDYYGIEIKVIKNNSRGKIHLMNSTPDGDYLYPIKRIIESIGYPDKEMAQFRVFNVEVDCKEYKKLCYGKKIILHINREEEKLELIGYNHLNEKLDIGVSWSFDLLRKSLYTKLEYLAIVRADEKYTMGVRMCRFNELHVFKLKSFEKFLWLLENGVIKVNFKIGVFKSGKRIGQIHDRGTDFSINYSYLNNLFDKISN